VITWIVTCYAVFAFLMVGSAAATAMWAAPDRRKDAYKVYKLSLALLTGAGGLVGVVITIARIEAW
jgi:hypothetical protein